MPTLSKTRNKLKRQELRNNEYYDLQSDLDGLYARSSFGCTFHHLMEIIQSEQNILKSYRAIKKNKGSRTCGVDGKNINDIGKLPPCMVVETVRKRLDNFQPQKVRRVEIPKQDGRKRPLGIPTIWDRLVQQCILQVLEPICEARFYNHSYGFRPLRSSKQAIARAYFLAQIVNLHYVVDIDIKGFFDNINHTKLLKQLWTLGIQDKRLISVISKMLKAEIEGVGIPTKGTPQGGILSPLLANIVLNEMDWWISSQWEGLKTRYPYTNMGRKVRNLKRTNLKEVYIVRYADDFKLFCRKRSDAQKLFCAVQDWLGKRLQLEINSEKSRITNLKKGYSGFLGIKLKVKQRGRKKGRKREYTVTSHIAKNAIGKILHEVKQHIIVMQNSRGHRLNLSVDRFNAYILGLHNYYNCATMCAYDFARIAFLSQASLKGRLKLRKRRRGEELPQYIEQRYGKSARIRFIKNKPLIPIGYVLCVPIKNSVNLSVYKEQDRAIIHAKQKAVPVNYLCRLLKSENSDDNTEYNDNRISLYVGQYGKCFVTGRMLEPSEIICRHKVPLCKGGTDEYSNLVIVSRDISNLIQACVSSKISLLTRKLALTVDMVAKINILRKFAGSPAIAL